MFVKMWVYGTFVHKTKLAMFDLDDTLIDFSASDTPTFSDTVIKKLQGIKDHSIIVITNQLLTFDKGEKEKNFKSKVKKFCEEVGRPMVVICCHKRNFARKPGTGALEHYLKEFAYQKIEDSQANYSAIVQEMYGITLETVGNEKQFLDYFDYKNSFYVGDAAGKGTRPRTDDIGFAINVGVKFYTPEAYFENEMNDYQVKHIDMQQKRRSTGAATEATDDSTGDSIENYDFYETVFIYGGASLCGKHFFASKFLNAKNTYYNCRDEFLMKKVGKHEKTICCQLDYDAEVQRWLKNFCYLTGQKSTGTTVSRVDTKKYKKYFTDIKNIKFEFDDSKYNEDQKKAARLFL